MKRLLWVIYFRTKHRNNLLSFNNYQVGKIKISFDRVMQYEVGYQNWVGLSLQYT